MRDKYDIRETILGLDFINKLKPVDFKWDYRTAYITYEEVEETDLSGNIIKNIKKIKKEKDGSMKRNRYHHGFIAQDIQELIKDTNIDFGGFHDAKITGGDDELSLGLSEFISPMVKAIQELSMKNIELEKTIKILMDRLDKIENNL